MTTSERVMVRRHLLAAGFRRLNLTDKPQHYDVGKCGVYTEEWSSVADRTTITLDWDRKTPEPSEALERETKGRIAPELYDLINHLKEYSNAVSADLEQGVHWLNNIASDEFAKKHPSQLKWADKMGKLIEQVETAFGIYV